MCNHSLISGKDGKRFIVVLSSREWLTLSYTASLVQTQKPQPGYQPVEKTLLRQNVNPRQGVIDKRVGLSHKLLMVCIMDVVRGLSNFARSLFLLTPAISKLYLIFANFIVQEHEPLKAVENLGPRLGYGKPSLIRTSKQRPQYIVPCRLIPIPYLAFLQLHD